MKLCFKVLKSECLKSIRLRFIKMDRRFLIFGLFLVFMAYKARCVAGSFVKFTNAVCKSYNESVLKINLCRIRAVNRYKNTFNYKATALHPITDLIGRVQVLKRANGYKPWLIDVSVDACQFIRKPSNAVLITMVKQFKNFTNLLDQKCPMTGTKSIDGLYLDAKKLNLPVPTGEYMLYSSWIINKQFPGDINVSIQFVEDLI